MNAAKVIAIVMMILMLAISVLALISIVDVFRERQRIRKASLPSYDMLEANKETQKFKIVKKDNIELVDSENELIGIDSSRKLDEDLFFMSLSQATGKGIVKDEMKLPEEVVEQPTKEGLVTKFLKSRNQKKELQKASEIFIPEEEMEDDEDLRELLESGSNLTEEEKRNAMNEKMKELPKNSLENGKISIQPENKMTSGEFDTLIDELNTEEE